MPSWKSSLVAALTKSALGLERLVRPQHRADPAAAERVLVLQFPSTLGCMVLETPIFEALRRGRPDRKIAVATYGLGLQILRHSPHVDELIELPNPADDLVGSVRRLRRELRERGFRPDCVLTAAFDRQRAITRLAVLAGRAWRGGFAEEPWMYDVSLSFDQRISVMENNLRVAALLGCDGHGIEPRIFFSQQDADAAKAIFADARQRARPVMSVIAVGKSGPPWHQDRFAEVIRYASQKLGYEIFFTGTAREAEAIEALRLQAGSGTSLAGMESIPGQTALFALSDLVLTIDTGPMHMARASGAPMVVLAGCWERPYIWLPVGLPQVKVVQGPYDPRPGDNYHMDDLSVAEVKAAVDEMARHFPSDTAAQTARAAAGLSHK
jgi:ADP-heptose:LPS heptosyltransferase